MQFMQAEPNTKCPRYLSAFSKLCAPLEQNNITSHNSDRLHNAMWELAIFTYVGKQGQLYDALTHLEKAGVFINEIIHEENTENNFVFDKLKLFSINLQQQYKNYLKKRKFSH